MFSHIFLAQTDREMAESLPKHLAYMALHFSPYSAGLSNAPKELPAGSILLLDDSMPPNGHDPQAVVNQLRQLVVQFSSHGVLLDFQRQETEEAERMVICILEALSCPVAVTKQYAKNLHCPVFLPPLPVNKSLKGYLQPWLKQGVYLEIAPEASEITVTEQGSTTVQIPLAPNLPLQDEQLHCHYNVEVFPDKAVFTICRNNTDLQSLVQEAEAMGVLGCVGLYKELHNI